MGREGKLTQRLKEKIKEYELERAVTLMGHRSDVNSLLAAADIFVFPSRFEGLPGALIEAEAAGLPVVCSDIPNNREVAVEGRNAIYFAVNDADQLKDGLVQLIEHPEKSKQMGAESLLIFNERFSIDKIHRQMLSWLLKAFNS